MVDLKASIARAEAQHNSTANQTAGANSSRPQASISQAAGTAGNQTAGQLSTWEKSRQALESVRQKYCTQLGRPLTGSAGAEQPPASTAAAGAIGSQTAGQSSTWEKSRQALESVRQKYRTQMDRPLTGNAGAGQQTAAGTDIEAMKSAVDRLEAQDKTWWGTMDWDAYDRARIAYNDAVAKQNTPEVIEWEGRADLIRELNEIDDNSVWITDAEQASDAEHRRMEIIKALEAGDAEAGNGLQSYNDTDRARQIMSGSTKDYLSGLSNFFGTSLAALRSGVDTNPYAGWATDPLSATNIPYEHDETKLSEYDFLQRGSDTLEQTADRLGGSAATDLESAKAGLSSFGKGGVDIATNIIQMGYDAALGRLLGGNSLIPMFIRSSGSASREARQDGANVDQQLIYGIAKGGIEVATEKLTDGVAKIYGAGVADNITEGVIRKLAQTETGRTLLRIFIGAVGEGSEEVISDVLAPLAEIIYKGEGLGALYRQIDPTEVIYDFLIGAAIGGLGTVTSVATGQNSAANTELRVQDSFQREAEGIIADPAARAAYEAETGKKLTGPRWWQIQQIVKEKADNALRLGTWGDYAGTQEAFGEDITDAQLEALQQAAARAMEQDGLDENAKTQFRILQAAAETELQQRAERTGTAGITEGGRVNGTQAQREQGILGQEETLPAPGGKAGRAGEADSNTEPAAAGPEAAQPDTAWAVEPDGIQQRNAGAGAGGKSERLAGSTAERSRRAAEQRRVAAARQSLGNALWERGEVNLTSAQELGIADGSDTQDLKVFPRESYDQEMQEVYRRVAYETGLPVTFVSGLIHTRNTDGSYGRRRAVITGNGIIIQADNHNTSVTQLAEHEIFHAWQYADPALRTAAWDKILQTYSREEFARVLQGYIKSHRGIIDVDENTDVDTMDEAAMDLIEEILADAHADINAFGLGAYQFRDAVEQTIEERRSIREQNPGGQRITRGPPQRFSYAGEKALDADIQSLDTAREMEREGKDQEKIRQSTGWFRGMDGKWRFEIDDSGISLKTMGSIPNYTTLGELLDHVQLFDSYPELEDMGIIFQNLGSGKGSYSPKYDDINLDYSLKKDQDELLNVLLHEAQHAIQDREGFASGSNKRYWEKQIQGGYDARTKSERETAAEIERQYHQVEAEDPEFFEEASQLMLSAPTTPRGAVDFDTLEQLEEDPPEWKEFDARRDALEGKYGDRLFDFMFLFDQFRSAQTRTRRTASDLYMDTAGEIEARDTTKRRSMDAEQRKNTRPDIDREDVVFAYGGSAGYAMESEKIRPGMDDQQRAKILEAKRIQTPGYDPSNEVNAAEIQRLEGMYISRAGEIFKTIAEKCGVFRTYRNEDVGIAFAYSRSGLQESKHKQRERGGTAEDFGKMLTVLPQIIDGAVEIDAHTDRYAGTAREDSRLKEMHVLLGAFRDGTDVIPVQLEIKEYLPEVQQANKLYVTVTLTTKEAGIMPGLHASQKETLSAGTPASEISIADILRNVNDPNGKLVKYLPDSMLNEEQRAAKEKALEKDQGYLKELRERPVNERRESARGRRDSAGNKLSKAQREFFKDSVVRDRSGNLLVVYHQTENDFTVFDPRRKGAGSRDTETPYGIFLKSNDRDIGLKGKKQMALYANIKNPLRVNNREDLRYRLTRLSDTYRTLIAREAALDREYHQRYEDAQKAWREYVSEWSKKNPGAPRTAIYDDPKYQEIDDAEDAVLNEWEAASTELAAEIKDAITSALEDNGYDGIILLEDKGSFGRSTDAYIALHPDQVKNVDNKNPTSNPDIRYSTDDSIQGTIYGDADETFVNDTEPVKFRWAIVPLESLVISNDTTGEVNPNYPAELQPRNRARQASQLQMQKISQNLNPRQLEDSPNAQNGAPIIRADGVVIGGNIRSMALTDAYDKGRAGAYRNYLVERAARKFGLDTSELPERPVLVRVAEDVRDWAQLARDLNTSTVAAYSATERAMSDAARMDSRIMAMLNPDEDGNINTAANRDFIQSFIANVVPTNERGAAITGSGLLSQDGLERAEYAIFAAAYQDADLMQRMSESLDNDMKNVTNALLDIAPRVVQAEAEADAGRAYDVGARKRILEAVDLYTGAKRARMTVEEYTANRSLTEDWSDETIYVARYIEKYKRSAKQIRTFFNGLFDEIESYGDPNQLNFFGEEDEYSYREALEGAIKRYEQATGTELPRLNEWGAGEFETVERRSAQSERHDTVFDGGNPSLRKDSRGRQSLDGERGDAEPVETETPEDTALHLPPPPGAETPKQSERIQPSEQAQAESSARQRDLQRMAERRKKDLEKQRRRAQRQQFPRWTEYNPLKEFVGADDPVKEYIKAAQARAAAEKTATLMQADKRYFTGSPALQKLGVHIQNSVGNYAHVDQLLARERAAYQLRKTIRREEAKLRPSPKEKQFAAGIAAGVYTAEDIPANMDRYKVEAMADYYWAEKAVASDMIAQRRKDINLGLDEQMDELLKDSDLYKVPPAVVLNYRTPERLCKSIWGDEHGQAVYDAIFRPVSINEAEKTRFINRMFDEVRTFEGKDGKRSELTKEERMLTQQVLEGRAVQELVASMEMREAVENAAQNILNGEDPGDAAREFGLTQEDRGIAGEYARWLQTEAIYESGDFDTVKIDNAVKKYSEMYDKMYDAINDFLVAHGYDPIGFIKGYAPHMQMNEDLNLFAGYLDRLGFNTNVTRLPTSIAGRTADYKPNKRWNPYFLQRTGDMTDFDIAKGFESYVNYLSDVLYHTDDIMRVRAMSRYYRRTFAPDEIRETLDWVHQNENASMETKEQILKDRGIIDRNSELTPRDIQATFDEWVDKQYESIENMTKYSDYVSYLDNYANLLAGKQSSIDRGAEALLGRESLNWGNKLVRSFQRTQVAGSFSSALNQSAQLPQIRAELGTKYTARAIQDFVSGAARKGAWAQESDFLTGKRGVDMLVTDAFDMVMNKAFAPATFVDSLMSTIAVRGKYLKEIDAGKSHTEAMVAADQFGRSIMGSRVKGEKPIGFQSKRPTVQMLNMFQIEALNSWEHLSQDLPEDFRRIEKQDGTKAAATALAGVIVKMLLSAFLLNRLAEELYGGSPAPFDIIGLSANFVASGYGLTTNQYLRTVIDNGLEKLTGDRRLGTDRKDMRDTFDWGDAMEDTGYNISNDIPFFRNIAGLMGWGDQTLPLPLMGAGKDLENLVKDMKNDITNRRISSETGMDLLRIMNQLIPGGRQLTKTAEGLQLMSQGGREINGKLYYPVENSMGNWIKALLFGRSALYESNAYYAAGNSSLSQSQTEMYKALISDGADRMEVYRTILDYRAVDKNKDLGSYEKGRQQREIITNADLSDEQRLELYRGVDSNNQGRADDFEEVMETGLSWAETVAAYDRWAELNANEDLSKSEKAESYAAWVELQGYSDEEKDAVRRHFKFWQSIPIENTQVDKFTGAGMNADDAEMLSGILDNLEPLPGQTKVTDLQKYKAIAESGLSVESQWDAIIAQTNPTYTSTLDKIEIMRQQGISPSVWTASKEAMYAADDAGNNNGSTDQKEARAALEGMDIPNWQKAVLWQTTNRSWKPKSNPFDKEVGQAVYDILHGDDQATGVNTTTTGVTINLPGEKSTLPGALGNDWYGNETGLTLGTWGENSGAGASPNSGVTIRLPKTKGDLELGTW